MPGRPLSLHPSGARGVSPPAASSRRWGAERLARVRRSAASARADPPPHLGAEPGVRPHPPPEGRTRRRSGGGKERVREGGRWRGREGEREKVREGDGRPGPPPVLACLASHPQQEEAAGRCSRATPVGCGLGAREARALGLERVAPRMPPRVPPPQRRCSPGGGGGRWVTRSFMLRHLRRDHRVVTVRVWDGRREPGRCGGVDPGRAGGEHHHHCHCVRRWTRRPGTRPRRYFRGAQEPCHNFMP